MLKVKAPIRLKRKIVSVGIVTSLLRYNQTLFGTDSSYLTLICSRWMHSLSTYQSHEIWFCRDLDATVMRAIASLLSGLPLQPEGMETDIMEAKSQLFLK